MMSNKNDWHERGELPPVGEVVECYDADGWQKCKILAVDSIGQLVVELLGDKKVECNHPNEVWTFRPLRTERDVLVEDMLSHDCEPQEGMLSRRDFCAALIDAGWRPVKQQSEDEFVKETHDYLPDAMARTAYRAGCRFVERGSE